MTDSVEEEARAIAGANYEALIASGMTPDSIVAAAAANPPIPESEASDSAEAPVLEDPAPAPSNVATEKLDGDGGGNGANTAGDFAAMVKDANARFKSIDATMLAKLIYKRAPLRLKVQRTFLAGKVRGDIRPHLLMVFEVLDRLVGPDGVEAIKRSIVQHNNFEL